MQGSLQAVPPDQPVWVLSELAGASGLPLVVFPAWLPETGPLLGVPGSHWLLQSWAGLEGGASVPGAPVRVVVRAVPGPPPCLLLAKLRCSSYCVFSTFTQRLGCSRNASPRVTLLPGPVTMGGENCTGKKPHAWSN